MAGQDTMMKALTRSLSGGALDVLGIRGVELVEPLPTELPVNTLRVDKVWQMQDGRLFHLEFQSTQERELDRFLEYDVRLWRHHKAQIRTVVLYHSNVANAPEEMSIGTAVYRVENIFLSQLDGDKALKEVERHLQAAQWEPQDRLRLALALNMKVQDVSAVFERVLELVPAVPDESERDLVVSAILALGEHALNEQQRIRIRGELRKVSRIADELYQEGREEERVEIACKLLEEGVSIDVIVKTTGLSRERIDELRKELH